MAYSLNSVEVNTTEAGAYGGLLANVLQWEGAVGMFTFWRNLNISIVVQWGTCYLCQWWNIVHCKQCRLRQWRPYPFSQRNCLHAMFAAFVCPKARPNGEVGNGINSIKSAQVIARPPRWQAKVTDFCCPTWMKTSCVYSFMDLRYQPLPRKWKPACNMRLLFFLPYFSTPNFHVNMQIQKMFMPIRQFQFCYYSAPSS